MVSEKQYRVACRLCAVCVVMLMLTAGLAFWVAYDCLQGNAHVHNVASVVINIVLFACLLISNRKIIKAYKADKYNPTKSKAATLPNIIRASRLLFLVKVSFLISDSRYIKNDKYLYIV